MKLLFSFQRYSKVTEAVRLQVVLSRIQAGTRRTGFRLGPQSPPLPGERNAGGGLAGSARMAVFGKNVLAMLGLAAGALALGLTVSAAESGIPAEVIRVVEDGIEPGSVIVHRVAPTMTVSEGKIQALAKSRPEELLRHLVQTTNTIRILTRASGVSLVEQSLAGLRTNGPSVVIRYGWTPHFIWKHTEGESMPWVIPVAEIPASEDPFVKAIAESIEAFRIGHEHLLRNLGLPWLGKAVIRHDPQAGVFVATLASDAVRKFQTNEVVLHPQWSGNQLELAYQFLGGKHSYLSQIRFGTAPNGVHTIESVHTYSVPDLQARPDPRALVEAVLFQEMGEPKVNEEEARSPMRVFKWKEWFEFLAGRWVVQNMDGSTQELPGFGRQARFSGSYRTITVLVLVSSGVVCLLLTRGLWQKMARSRMQHHNKL